MDNRYTKARAHRPGDIELAKLYRENTLKEIADMYGVSVSTVKSWIRRMSIRKG